MITCPACNSSKTKVTNTSAVNAQRRRWCHGCWHVFYTQELVVEKTLRPRKPPADKRVREPRVKHITSIDLSLLGVWK